MGYQATAHFAVDFGYQHQFVSDARVKLTNQPALGYGTMDGKFKDHGDVLSLTGTYSSELRATCVWQQGPRKRPLLAQGNGSDPRGESREFARPTGSVPPDTQNAPNGAFCVSGGEGGIRTHGTLTRTPDFESGA
ncbi:hypothetical protein RLIN73S_00964 [Rhodanobacter lindaniclasticus]